MSRAMVPLVLVVALAVTACQGEGQGSIDVRPFADVQASELVFENDPSTPDQGIFRVTTSEPMICAIVWGETEELGRLNNTLGMDGTGIVEHDVVLPGARAGETYHFRVQGSTADGTLYSTGLMTFTLPERADEPGTRIDLSGNLAERATVVEVSSEAGDAFAAGNAIDGDLSTEWSSSGDGDAAFIAIDLGEETGITRLGFLTRSMADGSSVTRTFSVLTDGGEAAGPFPAGTLLQPEFATVELRAEVLRFEVEESSGGNTGAVEVLVFGEGSDG